MSDILTHLLSRRSIRRYTDEPVASEQFEALLQAAMAAPSASNRRPWEFVVVTEAEQLDALRGKLVFGRYRAPACIVVCGNMRIAYPGVGRDFWIEDCSAAMQNILLAATGLGLGSVWVGVYPIKPMITAVSRVLNMPEYIVPLGVAWVGHPAEVKLPRTQYDDRRVHWQVYEPRKIRHEDRVQKPKRFVLWPFGARDA